MQVYIERLQCNAHLNGRRCQNCKTPKTATFCVGCSMAFGGPIFICHPDKDDCWDQIHDPMREIPEYDPKSA